MEAPLAVASMLFLTSYAIHVLAHGLPEAWRDLCLAVTLVSWAMFAVDYAVRWRLSGQGHRFVRTHWLDTVVLVLPCCVPCAWSGCTRPSSAGRDGHGSPSTRA